MGFSSWPRDAGPGKIRPVRFLGKIFSSCYIMTTKNNSTDNQMSIKVDLHDKYDRKALTFINGFDRYGLISIKKSFVDQRRKFSSTVTGPLKPKYSRPFKKARAKAEFNDFFALESNETKLSGRSWTRRQRTTSRAPRMPRPRWTSRRSPAERLAADGALDIASRPRAPRVRRGHYFGAFGADAVPARD